MIKQTKIVNEQSVILVDERSMSTPIQYLSIEFTDGTFVNLNEEELKNAAALAEKGCLSD